MGNILEETDDVVLEPTPENAQPIPGNTESITETDVTSAQEKSHSNENPSSSNPESEK